MSTAAVLTSIAWANRTYSAQNLRHRLYVSWWVGAHLPASVRRDLWLTALCKRPHWLGK